MQSNYLLSFMDALNDQDPEIIDIMQSFECHENEISNTVPTLKLEIQPINKFRYRYRSEKGSHGSIVGESIPKMKKTFPTVKLENCTSKNVIITARLYTPDEPAKPHILELMGKDCSEGVCYRKLDKNFSAKFQNMSIVSRKKDEVLSILREIKLAEMSNQIINEDEFQKQIVDESKTFNMNAARLCFEAFYEGSLEYPSVPVPQCKKVFSNIIYNQKSTVTGDLKICRMSRPSGKINGGEEIILLCDKIKKDDIRIEFFEKDDNGDTIWSGIGEFSPTTVHYQVAIPFKTPKYDGVITEGSCEKLVHIQLFRPSDEKHSKSVPFCYIFDNNMKDLKKRKLSENVESLTSLDFNDIPFCDSRIFRDSNYDGGLFTEVLELSNDNFGSESSSSIVESPTHHLNFPDLILTKNAIKYNGNTSKLENNFQEKLDENQDNIPHAQMAVWTQMKPKNRITATKYSQQYFGGNQSECKISDLSFNINRLLQNKRLVYYASKGISVQDINGNSLLHLVIIEQSENIQFIRQLLNVISKEVINHNNKRNETPLYLATSGNHWEIMKLLLQFGAQPDLKNMEGNNCFHVASKNNFSQCLEELINLSIINEQINFTKSINSHNFDGLTPLHLSVLHKSKECLKLLLNAKADINIRERTCGRTSLHLAIQLQPSLISELLLQKDIDISIEDYRGYTALQTACEELGCSYEDISEEIKTDKNKMALYLIEFYADEEEEEEWNTNNMSCSYENSTSNENAIDLEFEQKVWNFLNARSNWRKLGIISDTDEKSLDIIEKLDDNPAKALVNKIKKTQKLSDTKDDLKKILNMAGLSKQIDLIESSS